MLSIYTDSFSRSDTHHPALNNDGCNPDCTVQNYPVYYVSAMCGAGKTYALANRIADQLTSKGVWKAPNFIYVCPTIQLMEQFQTELERRGVLNVHKFNSNEMSNVTNEIRYYMEMGGYSEGGHVVLITHKAYMLTAHMLKAADWHIYIDEIPQFTETNSPNIEFSNRWLEGVITGKQYNAELIELFPQNHEKLKAYKKSKDEGVKPFHPLLHALASKNYQCFATVESYRTLKADPLLVQAKTDFQFCYIIIAKPSIFAWTTIMGANFELSMLYDHLIRHGFNPIRDEKLSDELRYTAYPTPIRDRIRIEYVQDRKYSKTMRGLDTTEGENVKAAMDARILQRLGQRPFLLLTNRDDEGALVEAPNAEHLPHKSYGLNEYAAYTTVVCMVSYNRKPVAKTLHLALGFSERSIRHTTLIEEIHQAIMRSNARDLLSDKEILVILNDVHIAREIVQLVGCANAIKIAGPDIVVKRSERVEREYDSYTKTQLNQRCSTNNYFTCLGLIDESSEESLDSMGYDYLNTIDNKHPIETIKTNTQPETSFLIGQRKKPGTKSTIRKADGLDIANEYLFTFTFHKRKKDYKPEQFKTDTFTIRELVNRLKTLASTIYEEKEQRKMYNPAEFEPLEWDHKYRTKSNWLSSSALILDFDSGKLKPEDFIRIFYTECTDAERHSFIIYNSFSRSEAEPNRFHVVIPYQSLIFDIELHKAIYDYVEDRLTKAGFPPETSGMDKASRHGVQSFYCPCTNRKHPDSAFFKCYGTAKPEFKKHGLNPSGFKSSKPQAISGEKPPKRIRAAKSKEIAEVELQAEVEAIRNMHSGRHKRFFKLAHRLNKLSYSAHDALPLMIYAGNHEPEMIEKAKHNIWKVYKLYIN